MDIIVNHSSMQPIYEQIGDQIKEKIMHGILKQIPHSHQFVL